MLINSLIINLLKNFFKFHRIVEEKEKAQPIPFIKN